MKIAIVTHTTHHVGGLETYLGHVVPALRRAGHTLAIACEHGGEDAWASLTCEGGATLPVYSVEQHGANGVVEHVRRWCPDLVYAHGLGDPGLEEALVGLAPTVFFLHGYHGSCISGLKRFAWPSRHPCDRVFGPRCLVAYFPRRCGGLSPRTMFADYRRQVRRLRTLRSCAAVVVHSAHMRRQYARHGVTVERLHHLPFMAPALSQAPMGSERRDRPDETVRITFAGRIEPNKGVDLLISAAPLVAQGLSRPVHIVIAGEGGARAACERQARAITARAPAVAIEFTGWLSPAKIALVYASTDVLALPSVWPEPFGLVGPEAGHHGVPAAAFAVGGLGEWLVEGVNGHFAPGDPPRARGLAEAIGRCVRDPDHHARLRRGARDQAASIAGDAHLRALLALFARTRAEHECNSESAAQ